MTEAFPSLSRLVDDRSFLGKSVLNIGPRGACLQAEGSTSRVPPPLDQGVAGSSRFSW